VQFGYITGWRIPSEVLRLQWRHVDFEARVIRLDPHTTKNDEGRTFPFTDALEQLLEAQKGDHDRLKAEGVICPWVFNRTNKKVKGRHALGRPASLESWHHRRSEHAAAQSRLRFGLPCVWSSRYNHARARRHSRLTVRGDRCSTCAISSTLRPAKKRSSTMRA
jgi:integrase